MRRHQSILAQRFNAAGVVHGGRREPEGGHAGLERGLSKRGAAGRRQSLSRRVPLPAGDQSWGIGSQFCPLHSTTGRSVLDAQFSPVQVVAGAEGGVGTVQFSPVHFSTGFSFEGKQFSPTHSCALADHIGTEPTERQRPKEQCRPMDLHENSAGHVRWQTTPRTRARKQRRSWGLTDCWYAQGESNPCLRRERAPS